MRLVLKYNILTVLVILAVSFSLPSAAISASNTTASIVSSAKKDKTLDLNYNIYAGGFKALNASLQMEVDKKAYDMKLEAHTQGFIGKIFPWSTSLNTSGHNKGGKLIPALHTEHSTWKQNTKMTEVSYTPSGDILKTTTQNRGKTTTNRDVNTTISANSVDILTGTLKMLKNVKDTDKCQGEFPVFDGKRKFNLTLTDDGTEVLEPSKYSRFSGKALRCTLKVKPVAGFNKKDKNRGWMAVQNHTEERRKLPTLWIAKLPNIEQPVLVRMEIASDYGSVVAHLSK